MKAAKPLRIARWLLLLGLLPPLLYLLAANLFLRFGLPLAFESTNTVNATVKSAWSVWPGVVHVRGARIVFQDHNLQWSLDLEQARVELALRELLQRTFHAREVTGSGASFRMRHRIQPESKAEPWVATLPPIPEFPAPAVFEARVPEAPLSDAEYNLWTVHIENVDVGVREIWAHFIRFQGEGRARGTFRLRPARTLWVGPASLSLQRGVVSLGKDELAKKLSGTIDCVVHPFDVRKPEGREVFRFISTELELRGEGVTPEPIVRQFFADSALTLSSAPGSLRLSAKVQRGRFAAQSLLEADLPELSGSYRDFAATANQVNARILAQAGDRAESRVRVASGTLSSLGKQAKAAPAQLTGMVASVLSSGLDAAGDAALVERKLDVEQVRISDARLLDAFAASKLHFASGRVEFGLSSSERQGAIQAALNGRVQRLVVGNARTQLKLDGQFKGALNNANLETGAASLNLDAALTSAGLHDFSEGKPHLVLDEREKLTLSTRVERGASGRTRTHFQLRSQKATLALVDGAQRRELAQFADLRVKGALSEAPRGILSGALNATTKETRALLGATWLRARARLELEVARFDTENQTGDARSELTLEHGAAVTEGGGDCPWATVPWARVRSRIHVAPSGADATVHAALERASLLWGDFRATGGVELDARIGAEDLERRRGDVDLAIRARKVTLTSGTRSDQGWQAEVPSLAATAKLHADDKLSGTLALSAERNRMRIGGTRLETDFKARTALSSIDLDRREARFSGTFSLSNARLAGREQRVEGWWANIHADSALLVARENVDLSLPFRAELRDGEPGMAILVEKGSLPAMIADAVPLRSIDVVGTVQRRCRLTNIRFTQASGGPLVGRGLLNSTTDRVRGAFLLRLDALRAISAGVSLDSRNSEQSGVSLLAGDDWLRERTEALDENVRKILDAPCPTPPSECGAEGSDE